MADQIQKIFEITSKPGIKRDGTSFDKDFYSDGQWIRFQRGRPKKMGGYSAISNKLTGPIRSIYTDSRLSTNSIHSFSPWGIQRLQVDNNGVGGAVYDRTPSGFTENDNYSWSTAAMYSSTGGSFTALIAASTPDMDDISSDTAGGIYYGDITGTAAFSQISDGSGVIQVSGGCTVLQPFLFVYGSNGLIRNSNANDFSASTGWTTGGSNYSNSANPCATKIVKGMPMRGGSGSPAGLFWSLDSLIRVTFVGGTRIWTYDTVSADISVMSKHSMVEYSGLYFWIGIDRFYVYNGVVQELPNQMNANWFFDNLNYSQRQKVWGVKVPRYGEIWWFYPRGTATECTDVIIYNVREQTWYDNHAGRSAGMSAQLLGYPVMAGIEDSRDSVYLTYAPLVGSFSEGDTITGMSSSATGTIARLLPGSMNLVDAGTAVPFTNGETITNGSATGILTAAQQSQQLDVVWKHETGHDKISGQDVTAIQSYVTTANFSYKTAGPAENLMPTNVQTTLVRVEPDFVQSGEMNMYVEGGNYANSENIESAPYSFTSSTEHIDPREQRGIMSIKFESNVIGGNFEMGQVLVTVEPGDERG